MNILVTGGAGFIGSNFIRYWLQHHSDDHIVNIDKLVYAGNPIPDNETGELKPLNLVDLEKDERYTFVHADICDYATVLKTLQYHKIDTIVHFAAQSHVDRSVILKKFDKLDISVQELFETSLPEDFVLNNVWGTHILLECATQAWQGNFEGKRFHHVSTDEVFGALPLDTPDKFDEQTLYQPRSPYSASKAGADHLVRAYAATFGLPVTISNTSNNYGPYQYPEKLLPVAILNIAQGKKVPIYGDGKYVRDWLYVDDHARAIDLILQKGEAGETYCIGGLTEDVNNLELIKKVLRIMDAGEELIEYVKDRPGHDRRYAVDWSKAQRELGYKPAFDLDTYLEKTISWYMEHERWWKTILERTDHAAWMETQYVKR